MKTINKKEKFKKLANLRLHNALVCIRRLESLADKRYYDYTHDEIIVINALLKDAIHKVETRYNTSKNKTTKITDKQRPDYFCDEER